MAPRPARGHPDDLVVGILLGLYPLLVVVRLPVTALYGAFRGLG